MQREGYWEYMGRKLREDRIEEMQKIIKDRIDELNDEICELKESKYVSQQLEFKF